MKGIDLPVEVDLPDGGCYQAFIKKITEEGVLVRFHENVKQDQLITFEKIRLLADVKTCCADYKEGDIIQVFSKPDGEVLDGWWKATVKLFKHDKCYVQYTDRQGEDLVNKDKIRHCSHLDSFKTSTVKVPQRLREICTDENVHNEFILRSGVLDVIYSHSQSALIFVSQNEIVHQKACLMSDVYIETLKDKKIASLMQERPIYKKFEVELDLLGHAIGTGGSNIKKAKEIEDIISINHNRKGRFTVCGKTAEAVQKASDILELRKGFFKVPKQFKDKITHRFVKKIVFKSLARTIIVRESTEAGDEECSLEIVGVKETIEKAKHLLSNQLSDLKTLKENKSKQVKATINKSVTVDISNMSEPKVKTELHINRQTGLNLSISVSKDNRTSWINNSQRLKKDESKPVKATTNKKKHGNLYPRLLNKKHGTPRTNFNSQEMYKQYKDRGRIKRTRIKGGRGKKRRGRRGKRSFGRDRHSMRVKDKNSRIGIKKAELKLPSPDIIVQPMKCLSNLMAKLKWSDSDVFEEFTKESFNSIVPKRYKAAPIRVKLEDFLVRQTEPELKLIREADSGEHIGSRKIASNKTTKTFDDNSLSGNDNPDLKEEQEVYISPLSRQQQTALERIFVTKFAVSLIDEPTEFKEKKRKRAGKKNDLHKVNEMEVLKCLVKKFPEGCSFDIFASTAYSLFRTVNMTEWFRTRSRRFHIYTTDSNIVYIAPFYRELNICQHYLNPSKLSRCDNPNCNDFHICKRFVRGNCERRSCTLPHDFNILENVKRKEKHGLQDFNDQDIVTLLNWRFPRLCHDYIYNTGGCRKSLSKIECPHLHYCNAYFFGKCKKGDECKFNHSFNDPHNSWVLKSCHLKVKSERALRYTVYVPPKKLKRINFRESTEKVKDSNLNVECAV